MFLAESGSSSLSLMSERRDKGQAALEELSREAAATKGLEKEVSATQSAAASQITRWPTL